MHRAFVGLILLAAVASTARADETVLQTFDGTTKVTTRAFGAADRWELRWTQAGSLSITVLNADGTIAAGTSASGDGSLYLPKGGSFYLNLAGTPATGASAWHVSVVQLGTEAAANAAGYVPPTEIPPPAGSVASTQSAPSAPAAPQMSDGQARAIVLIKGDESEGTGFLAHAADGTPAVITNIHVISNNPNLKVTTTDGRQVAVLAYRGAPDRDAAMMTIKDDNYTYLDLAPDVSRVLPGEAVLTPGNSEGGEVFLNTTGEVKAIGPDKVEITNPIFHGNSGGPVIDVATGKVLGAVYMGMAVKPTDALDTASLANPNSAISGTMRYFAVRIDNVTGWETYDWNKLLVETRFLHDFHRQTRILDSYLNGARYEKNRMPVTNGDEGVLPSAHYFLQDDRVRALAQNYHDRTQDADQSSQMDASRELCSDLSDIANSGMNDIQKPENFYQFDQLRTKQEIAYRKAVIDELAKIGDRIGDLGH